MRWFVGCVVVLVVALLTWSPPADVLQRLGGNVAGPQPALPWRAGLPQLGVQVYWVDDPTDSPEVLRRKAARVFDHVVGLEANSVSISFPFFSESITASAVTTDARTPSPGRLGVVVDEARRSGLRVAVRPLLDEANLTAVDSRDWRGNLAPVDLDAWYASYQAFLEPYLVMAAEHQVATMVLGAELNSLQGDPHWAAISATARALYPGELAYASNWDSYDEVRGGVMPVDTVGIDAYPQLRLGPESTEADMAAAWTAWLDATVPAGDATLLFEVGAAAESRTLDNPAVPHRPGAALDEGIQARWLAAACAATRTRGLGGLYWWKIELDDEPAEANPVTDLHDSFLGRAAEDRMRACFAGWSAAP